jgi:serine/threonine protein kinase
MAGQIDHSGFLQKLGGGLIKQNQVRYFELRGVNLYWYKSKPASPAEESQGSVDLRNTKVTDNPKERFSFTISGPNMTKQYVLFASSEEEKRTWMHKLSNPNTSNTSTVQAKAGDDDDAGDAAGASSNSALFQTDATGAGGRKICADDFEIIRVVGKGSFGKVYQVRKVGTNEIYAMKEMSKEIIERENLLEHTFAEKSILQKINHPYIVKLHYAFQTKEKLFLVLDFLSGGELFFHLGQVQKFPEFRAKIYAAEIGLAIGHLHSLDIIYRDLKPENAVLDRDGHVCLTDFGLAKTNVRGATSAKTFCGTPEYLAPEFLLGSGHGKAVDWWSLGVLLYEMLCGMPPFYCENVTEMYELILKKPLEFTPEVSPAAQDLLRKLLDRNPATRLQELDKFKAHPFFADINWTDLLARRIPAPFKPDTNAVNFETQFTEMKPQLTQEKNDGKTHQNISGFTYDEQKK